MEQVLGKDLKPGDVLRLLNQYIRVIERIEPSSLGIGFDVVYNRKSAFLSSWICGRCLYEKFPDGDYPWWDSKK